MLHNRKLDWLLGAQSSNLGQFSIWHPFGRRAVSIAFHYVQLTIYIELVATPRSGESLLKIDLPQLCKNPIYYVISL